MAPAQLGAPRTGNAASQFGKNHTPPTRKRYALALSWPAPFFLSHPNVLQGCSARLLPPMKNFTLSGSLDGGFVDDGAAIDGLARSIPIIPQLSGALLRNHTPSTELAS